MEEFPVPLKRDLVGLRLPIIGKVVSTVEVGVPYSVVDAAGGMIEPIDEYIREFSAGDNSPSSCRSYAYDLLRWWRWLAAVDVEWDRATRLEVRDLVLWLRSAPNPQRRRLHPEAPSPGSVNAKTGKLYLAAGYAPTTIDHQLTVVGEFYEFHRQWARGPLVNPVPSGGRPFAHGNPMQPVAPHRRAAYRQKIPQRIPRALPDELWTELFATLSSHRDRAILATYISSGVRASELLGMRCGDVDFGRQTITVVSKGSRARDVVPVSPDALVWIRLYVAEGLVAEPGTPLDPTAPLWVTLRRPTRPLDYNAMRRVLQRANERIGANITLHDLRHTCAMRMALDPNMTVTDVQAVMRHKSLVSTQIYWRVRLNELVERMQEHYIRLASPPEPQPHAAYAQADLAVLFGQDGR